MQRFSLLLSIVSAGLAGFALALALSRPSPAPAPAPDSTGPLLARLEALERAVLERNAAPSPLSSPEGATAPGNGAGSGPAMESGPTLAAAAPTPVPTVPELARRLAEVEKAMKSAPQAFPGAVPVPAIEGVATAGTTYTMPTFYNNVDEAAKDLDLTPSQKADFERIVSDAKRDVDALKKIPSEDGTTWEQAQAETFKMTDGGFSFDTSKVQAFREKVIPGRNESFGAAERRIRNDAKRRLRDSLSADQQTKFDKAHSDGLVGGGGDGLGGLFITSFSTTTEVAVPEEKK